MRGATFSDEELRYIFDTIGTSPVTLIDLMSNISVRNKTLKKRTCPSVVGNVHQVVGNVHQVVGNVHQDLLAFPLKPIL